MQPEADQRSTYMINQVRFIVLAIVVLYVFHCRAEAMEPMDTIVLTDDRPGAWRYTLSVTYAPLGEQGYVHHPGGPATFVRQQHHAIVRHELRYQPVQKVQWILQLDNRWERGHERWTPSNPGGGSGLVSLDETYPLTGEISVLLDVYRESAFRPRTGLSYTFPDGALTASLSGSYIQDPIVINGRVGLRKAEDQVSHLSIGVGTAWVANDRMTLAGRAGMTIPMDRHHISSTVIGGEIVYSIVPGGDRQLAFGSLFDVYGGRTVQSFTAKYTMKFGK